MKENYEAVKKTFKDFNEKLPPPSTSDCQNGIFVFFLLPRKQKLICVNASPGSRLKRNFETSRLLGRLELTYLCRILFCLHEEKSNSEICEFIWASKHYIINLKLFLIINILINAFNIVVFRSFLRLNFNKKIQSCDDDTNAALCLEEFAELYLGKSI